MTRTSRSTEKGVHASTGGPWASHSAGRVGCGTGHGRLDCTAVSALAKPQGRLESTRLFMFYAFDRASFFVSASEVFPSSCTLKAVIGPGKTAESLLQPSSLHGSRSASFLSYHVVVG